MVLTSRRSWIALGVAGVAAGLATAAGCIGERRPERAAEPTGVAAYIWLEGADGSAVAVPDAVRARVDGLLRERNLVPTELDDRALAARLASLPTTEARLAALAAARPEPWVLLVEARAAFFSQISGRYRWDVDARATLAARGDLEHAQASTLGVAAFLQYDHEREPEALSFVRPQLAADLGALLDRVLKGAAPAR